MPVTITDPFKDGPWYIGGKPLKVGDGEIPYEFQPYLTGKEWEQYSDSTVYQADKAFREWASHMVQNSQWKKYRSNRRYIYTQLFQLIFGRPYNPEDIKSMRKISKIFAYYSVTINKNHYDQTTRKWKRRTCYSISSKCMDKPPYSLKLRIEEMMKNGVTPTARNMKLPKDDLTPGHSRNPNTERNKQIRAEKARKAYNEYQRKQRRVRAEQSAGEELGDA